MAYFSLTLITKASSKDGDIVLVPVPRMGDRRLPGTGEAEDRGDERAVPLQVVPLQAPVA